MRWVLHHALPWRPVVLSNKRTESADLHLRALRRALASPWDFRLHTPRFDLSDDATLVRDRRRVAQLRPRRRRHALLVARADRPEQRRTPDARLDLPHR